MRLLNHCPKQDTLLEFVSIPAELSRVKKLSLKVHLLRCQPCEEKTAQLRQKWESFYVPEPEVTSSLLSIYGRLQRDETLILKGWKLSGDAPTRGWESSQGALMVGLVVTQNQRFPEAAVATQSRPGLWASSKVPLAQIRYEEKNSVKVQYVQPELLQSTEFETTSAQ